MSSFFFFNDPATTEIYTLSLHDALPIFVVSPLAATTTSPSRGSTEVVTSPNQPRAIASSRERSEEHTSELQSRRDLVCRLLLEKKKKQQKRIVYTSLASTEPREGGLVGR